MADARRRYLRQLLELGEKDLVLDAPVTGPGGAHDRHHDVADAPRPSAGVEPPARLVVERVDAPPETPAEAVQTRQAAGSGRADGVGGPPMYRPGLVVEADARSSDLFTADPVAALPDLAALAAMVEACRKCGLGHGRTHTVPGEGNADADFVCVGEAPGATEDETGRPFVGRAGQLLNDILKAIGLAREDVFICNVLKCRPPGNRDPEPLEAQACSPYLHRQLELIRPKVILALGKPAATTLLNVPRTTSLGDLRGQVHRYRGTPLVVTYHPAALLRNPHWKSATWDDVRIARRILDGEPV